MKRIIHAPMVQEEIAALKSGDYVYITGKIYTARDAAHLRLYEAINNGQEIPMDLENNIIYYMGPSPAREGSLSVPPGRRPAAGWINTHRCC